MGSVVEIVFRNVRWVPEFAYTLLPEALRTFGNYSTHAIGKWNLGALAKDFTPILW